MIEKSVVFMTRPVSILTEILGEKCVQPYIYPNKMPHPG